MTSHRITLLVGAVLFGIAGSAQAAGDITIVRDLASRVGPVIGSAQACRDIGRPRIQTIVDKFSPGDPGSLVERGGAFRPHAGVRSQRGRRTHRRDLGQDGLHPGRPPARRSRTLDLRTEPLQRHRPVARRRRDRSERGNRADGHCPGRAAAARHRRKGNPLRHRSALLRLRQRAGPPDEARNRNRLQPGQRCRRRRRPDAQTVRRRRRLRARRAPPTP